MFLAFEASEQSKIFPNAAFGYWRITVERPLRLKVDFSPSHRTKFRKACDDAGDMPLASVVDRIADELGDGPHLNFNTFMDAVENEARTQGVNLTSKRVALLKTALAEQDESAEPVIKKIHKTGKVKADPIRGLYASPIGHPGAVAKYEADSSLRDTEQVPLLEEGGIEAFFRREVLPHVQDAWIDESKTQIGYEISFTRHFYKPAPLRTLAEIRADLVKLQEEGKGLLDEILMIDTVRANNHSPLQIE